MDNPETYVRLQRTIGVVHGEAFQLMRYASKDGSKELWFWNSRDGVTPFGMTIDDVEYTHAMNSYRARYQAALPAEAEYVWVDASPEVWRGWLHRRWERFKDSPKSEWHDPEKFLEQFPTPESFEEVEPFNGGQPRSITREEFLTETHSWMGKAGEKAADPV